MKRSNDDEPAKQPADSGESTKKQKVNDDDEEELQPQLDLMPKIPAIPQVVPLTEEEQAELKRKYRHTWQTVPKPTYRSKDYNLWPKVAFTVYRSQVNIQNSGYASEYIRHWFTEHEGLREPPPKAPRSAYSEYHRIKKREMFEENGKFTTKDNKKVGTMWKALTEDEQKVYHDIYDKIVAQYNVNNDFWEAEAEEWGKKKVQQLKESGEETDPEKRVKRFLSHLSAADFYYYKWW